MTLNVECQSLGVAAPPSHVFLCSQTLPDVLENTLWGTKQVERVECL